MILALLLAFGYYRYRQQLRKNIRLQEQLLQKEWLLKEIHHRVKNNLQFIISLLNIQSAYLDNEAAVSLIKDIQRRMYAMSLLHQKLYQSDDITVVDMNTYIRELITYLDYTPNIDLEINVDPIVMEVSQAGPIGLILNEAVTNAIKHAFPDNSQGIITITLIYTGTEQLMLRIADNGTGFIITPGLQDTLGMRLISILSEQLDGELTIRNNNGAEIRLLFKDKIR